MSKKGGAGASGKKGKGGGGAANEAAQQAQVLEALVLADSFDQYLRPVSLDVPRALMPLVGVPLLEYTLELLASNAVTLVHLFCCAHAEQVKRYVERSRWRSGAGASMQVQLVVSRKALNAGDALREMYAKGVLRNDFVLVSADVVATVSLRDALRAHREARQKDKEVLMTLLLQPTPPHHPSRAAHDQLMLATEYAGEKSQSKAARIVAYERDTSAKTLSIPLSALTESAMPNANADVSGRLLVRHDVLDTRIAICAPEVLFQFQDNFDYPDVPAFVHGVVQEEILGAKVSAFVLPPGSGYAARVNSWRQYRALTHDVVQRWTYPLVPDANMLMASSFRVQRDLLYREREVLVARSAKLGAECVLGAGSVIGAHATLERTVLGRNCVIGDGAVLIDALLWDNVVVEEGARIEGALLASRAHVSARAVVPKGCVLGEEVRVGLKATLQPHTLVAGARHTSVSGSSEAPELGEGGQGRRWLVSDARTLKGTTLWPREEHEDEAESLSESDTDLSDDDDDDGNGARGGRGNDDGDVYVSGRARFQREVAETVSRAFEAARHDPSGAVNLDSVRLEVGSLKLVYDFSFSETAEAILAGLLALLGDLMGSSNRAMLATALRRWVPLFDVYLASPSRPADEVELLYKVHELAAASDPAWRSRSAWPSLVLALMDAGLVQRSQVRTWALSLSEDEDEDEDARTAASDVLRSLDAVAVSKSNGALAQSSRSVSGEDKGGEAQSDEDEADLFDDTTDGWFSADKANDISNNSDSAAKAWWDDDEGDGDENETKGKKDSDSDEGEDDKGKSKGKEKELAASGSFWAADDSFEASDSDD